jgi:hypothetical protein
MSTFCFLLVEVADVILNLHPQVYLSNILSGDQRLLISIRAKTDRLNKTFLFATKWIHLVSGSKLTIKDFEFILNVDSVTTWARAAKLVALFCDQLNNRLYLIRTV